MDALATKEANFVTNGLRRLSRIVSGARRTPVRTVPMRPYTGAGAGSSAGQAVPMKPYAGAGAGSGAAPSAGQAVPMKPYTGAGSGAGSSAGHTAPASPYGAPGYRGGAAQQPANWSGQSAVHVSVPLDRMVVNGKVVPTGIRSIPMAVRDTVGRVGKAVDQSAAQAARRQAMDPTYTPYRRFTDWLGALNKAYLYTLGTMGVGGAAYSMYKNGPTVENAGKGFADGLYTTASSPAGDLGDAASILSGSIPLMGRGFSVVAGNAAEADYEREDSRLKGILRGLGLHPGE